MRRYGNRGGRNFLDTFRSLWLLIPLLAVLRVGVVRVQANTQNSPSQQAQQLNDYVFTRRHLLYLLQYSSGKECGYREPLLPLYAIADAGDSLQLRNISLGDYTLQLWVEGVPQLILAGLSRRIHITEATLDIGDIKVLLGPNPAHANKSGNPYDQNPKSPY